MVSDDGERWVYDFGDDFTDGCGDTFPLLGAERQEVFETSDQVTD